MSSSNSTQKTGCEDSCEKKEMTCKLTSPELRQRNATVIASLKKQVVEKKSYPTGSRSNFRAPMA